MTTHRSKSSLFRVLAFATAAGLAGGGFFHLVAADRQVSFEKSSVTVKVDPAPLERTTGGELSFAPIVKRVTPSVVKIVTREKGRSVEMRDSFPSWLFPPGFDMNPRRMQQPPREGLGSGVIVSPDGYVITNNHVIDGADRVTVTLADGREMVADVVGTDPQTDIAVLKIDGTDFPAITFADSEAVEVGDRVLAIGNPFDIGQTVTTGIVSGKSRSSQELGMRGVRYQDFIQTDAAINPGNSGGALVDARGRLIGINTAIYSRNGGFQGIGFAIPSSLARQVMDSLVTHGEVTRGFLGVLPQDVTPALAEQFKLENARGVLITEVSPDTPAEKAGLQVGDVIVGFNGQPVENASRFRFMVAGTLPGATVDIRLVRRGTEQTLQAAVGDASGQRVASGGAGPERDRPVLRGMRVADLTQQQRYEFEIPARIKGVIVTEVDPDSAAAAAGVSPGDVILEVEQTPIGSVEDFARTTRAADDQKTMLRIWSRGMTQYIVVDESRR